MRRLAVTHLYHFTEFPRRVDMQERKRRLCRIKILDTQSLISSWLRQYRIYTVTIDLPPHELRDLIRGIIWRDEHFNGMTIRDLAAREGHSEVFVGRLIHRTFETA